MKKNIIFLLLSVLLLSNGCGIYSFTGASIAPNIKTISVKYFANQTTLAPTSYSQIFTEALKRKFSDQTSLIAVTENGDLDIEGAIINYSVSPQAIQANQVAAMERLTVTVTVKFRNEKDPKQNFQQAFSRYAEFKSGTSISAVENQLHETINEALIEDIFTKAVVNW